MGDYRSAYHGGLTRDTPNSVNSVIYQLIAFVVVYSKQRSGTPRRSYRSQGLESRPPHGLLDSISRTLGVAPRVT